MCGRVLAYLRCLQWVPNRCKSAICYGVSITYGDESNHVWTYAVGHQETEGMVGNCPCNNQSGHSPPSFVGNDYYCEAGSLTTPSITSWYINDPLWDGMQCEEMRDLVVATLDCPGLQRTCQPPLLPVSTCVPVGMTQMEILASRT